MRPVERVPEVVIRKIPMLHCEPYLRKQLVVDGVVIREQITEFGNGDVAFAFEQYAKNHPEAAVSQWVIDEVIKRLGLPPLV